METKPNLKRVYVAEYGTFWSLPPDEWLDICKDAVDAGWDGQISEHRILKSRPNFVRVKRSSDGFPTFYTDRKDVRVVQPLDWYQRDFMAEIETLASSYDF